MLNHGFMSDVLGAGITEVSGGDYARANLPIGYWALTSNSIFVGETQPTNKYAESTLPVGCSRDGGDRLCVNTAASTVYLRGSANWLVGQRFYNIYDGPACPDAQRLSGHQGHAVHEHRNVLRGDGGVAQGGGIPLCGSRFEGGRCLRAQRGHRLEAA